MIMDLARDAPVNGDRMRSVLQASLKGEDAAEAFRVLYGGTAPSTAADAPDAAKEAAEAHDFHLLSSSLSAKPEQLRPARVTRIGLIQNKWPIATSSPLPQQRESIQSRIRPIVEAAGAMRVQVQPSTMCQMLFVYTEAGSTATVTSLSWQV